MFWILHSNFNKMYQCNTLSDYVFKDYEEKVIIYIELEWSTYLKICSKNVKSFVSWYYFYGFIFNFDSVTCCATQFFCLSLRTSMADDIIIDRCGSKPFKDFKLCYVRKLPKSITERQWFYSSASVCLT
jgi:hypothetical protein